MQTESKTLILQRSTPVEKMPGHWLLAQMGKRVLRPGGLGLTHQMLDALQISTRDDVVEFAPGLGVTARLTLARKPARYTAVERDPIAAKTVSRYLDPLHHRCVLGTAECTGLPSESASVVYGEAMLSMQPVTTKSRIIGEAARVLRPNGRYGIHELCLVPDDVNPAVRDLIEQALADEIHVGFHPLTRAEWHEALTAHGFSITHEQCAPMHLLEPGRLLQDEGLLRSLQFVWNVALNRQARKRVLAMRRLFHKFRDHLKAITIVAVKSPGM